MRRSALGALIGLALATMACTGPADPSLAPGGSASAGAGDSSSDLSSSVEKDDWTTDFSRLADGVSLNDFVRALPQRDVIPALERPAVVSVTDVGWLGDDEPVIAVERNGEWRAYPLQILLWHEIVNDVLGGQPVVVTFCPLCHTAVVFDPHLDGAQLDFGVSGYLRRSDLVMYDRQTESWWQQATGLGLVGDHAGRHLEILPSSLVAWSDFAGAHPEAGVLDRSTGYERPYGTNPYPGWDRVERNPFLGGNQLETCEGGDGCLDPKERVGVVTVNGQTMVFPFRRLAATGGLVEAEIGGVPVLVWWQPEVRTVLDNELIDRSDQVGTVIAFDRRKGDMVRSFELRGATLIDAETGSQWNSLGEATAGPRAGERLPRLQVDTPYWFAFAAFGAGYQVWPGEP
jgi:hypothetical protein